MKRLEIHPNKLDENETCTNIEELFCLLLACSLWHKDFHARRGPITDWPMRMPDKSPLKTIPASSPRQRSVIQTISSASPRSGRNGRKYFMKIIWKYFRPSAYHSPSSVTASLTARTDQMRISADPCLIYHLYQSYLNKVYDMSTSITFTDLLCRLLCLPF